MAMIALLHSMNFYMLRFFNGFQGIPNMPCLTATFLATAFSQLSALADRTHRSSGLPLLRLFFAI